MDDYLKLSDPQVKEAIYLLLAEKDDKLKRRDITCEGTLISVHGKPFLRYDRHLHYPKKVQHGYALYSILESVKQQVYHPGFRGKHTEFIPKQAEYCKPGNHLGMGGGYTEICEVCGKNIYS